MEQILKYLLTRKIEIQKEIEVGLRMAKERDTSCSNQAVTMVDLTEKEGGLRELEKVINVVEMFSKVDSVKNSEV